MLVDLTRNGYSQTMQIEIAGGKDGVGLPKGGTIGQVLAKASDEDYDFVWSTVESGGGGTTAQADWNDADPFSPSYIKNKPTDLSQFTNNAGYTTKEYVDGLVGVINAELAKI